MNNRNSGQTNDHSDKFDVYRKPYELPHHWQLRKEFLQVHSGKFDNDRLVCLSNVFINVECMGLTYPEEVMKLTKQLGRQVRGLEDYKHQMEQDEPELPRRQPKHNNNRRPNTNRSF